MKTKSFKLILAGLLIFTGYIHSQNTELPELLSYDQAISCAIQNNPDLKIKELNYLISIEKLKEKKLSLVPQVHGRYDLQRNLIIPSTLVPVGAFNPSLPDDELAPVRFGTNWSSGIGLVASVKIFDPQVIGDIREQKATLSLGEIDRDISRIDIEIETGKAYANCLLSLEQVKFAEDDTVNSFRELSESEAKYNAGQLKVTDLNLAILNHRNSVSRYMESRKILSDATRTLAYWTGNESSEDHRYTLTDSLEVLISRLVKETLTDTVISSSLTVNRLMALSDIEKIRLKNARAGFMPVISLNGLYGTDFYNNKLILGDENFWFGNSNLNLSLRMPITEGIGRIRKISQQKYQLDVNRVELSATRSKKLLERDRTLNDIEFFRSETTVKKSNLALARINYNAAFNQFSAGRILQSELSDAEISFRQAKIDYLKAVYGYIDSMLTLKRIIRS